MRRLTILAMLAALAAPAATGQAQPSDTAGGVGQGRLGRLTRYIGTFDYDAVLYDPVVSPTIYAVLGGRYKRMLIDDMHFVRRITASGTCLILQGSAIDASRERSMLAVNLANGAIEAAILDGGEVLVFSQQQDVPEILGAARSWAAATHARLEVRRRT